MTHASLALELLYATGMRRNELQQLKETDIEWSLNQIRILGKGNKERLVPVSAALLDSMRDYMQEKRKLADDEIDCSGTMEHTLSQVAELVDRLKRLAVAAI